MTDLAPVLAILEERRALLEGGPDSIGELQRRVDEAHAALDLLQSALDASQAELDAINEAVVTLSPEAEASA